MSKKIGMMQPYLFPYIGYFQLIAAVDLFMLADDLQYINKGWINRNWILMHGRPHMLQFPLKKASYLERINERVLSENFPHTKEKMLKSIYCAYVRAPSFGNFFPVLERLLNFNESNLAKYAENSIRGICEYLGITTPMIMASELAIDPDLRAQDRVIEAVRRLGGDIYINPIGGVRLYDFDTFERNSITLKFHRANDISYPQFDKEFVPSLSIIDVLMFNDFSALQNLLSSYNLEGRLSSDA